MEQRRESTGPLDDGADRGTVEADDQVALPMPGYGPVIDVIRTGTDLHLVGDKSGAELLRSGPRLAQCPPGAQARHQLPFERAESFDIQGTGRSLRERSASTHRREVD